jgi:formylglycine-generating enzyme required for sulfatase activity
MIKKFLPLILVFFTPFLYSKQNVIEKNAGGIDLVYIPAGSFVMGADSEGKDYSPRRTVSISKGFWMGKFEVTQKQYKDLTGINPCEKSKYGEGDSLPVYNISWYEAVVFCNKLSEANGLEPYYIIDTDKDDDNISQHDEVKWEVEVNEKADGFRLPTEAQWEYGCRAGTKTDYYWGKNSSWDVSGKYSWHMFNAGQKSYSKGRFWWVKYHKVKKTGTKVPNSFGLHDMNGNAAEWCFDRYSRTYYSDGEKKDPSGSDGEYVYRVARGGSMLDSPKDFTSYKRWPVEPFEKTGMNGLRVVLPE